MSKSGSKLKRVTSVGTCQSIDASHSELVECVSVIPFELFDAGLLSLKGIASYVAFVFQLFSVPRANLDASEISLGQDFRGVPNYTHERQESRYINGTSWRRRRST
jgi:hypothetical protein